jgi:hypothetical protein
MIKLYIGTQAAVGVSSFTHTSLKLADLNKEETVTLTTQINNFESISGQLAPYTLQFTIPCSDKNNEALQEYSKIDISSSINPHRAVEAKLEIGNMIEVIGSLEVKGYSWEDGKPKDYKVVFYGQEFSMKALLEKQLNEIDWNTDYDYSLTYANMKSSWTGGVQSGRVLLPVMSHVRDYLYQPVISIGQNHPSNIANNTAYYAEDDTEYENPTKPGIRLDELKTGLLLQAMVETIYEDIGVAVTWGTTIDAFLDNVFVIPSKEAGKAKNEEQTQDASVLVTKYDSASYQSLAIAPTWTTISMPTEIQDEDGLWSTDTFTAQATGIHKFELIYHTPNTTAGNCVKPTNKLNVRFRGYRNGESVFGTVSEYAACWIRRRVYIEGYLNNGDTLVFQGQTELTTAAEYKFYQLTMINAPTAFYGQSTAIGDNMPEMTAYDFLKGFMATFNLISVIELTEMGGDLAVQNIKLIDKNEFYTGGTVRDWTRYVSTGKRVYDKPQIDKDLVLKYSEYEDKVNIAFFRDALRNYAQLNYISDADFTGKEMDVESIFSVFPPSYLNKLDGYGQPTDISTDLLIHSQFDNNGDPINSDFLIFMYNGEIDIGNTYYIQTGVDANGEPTFDGTQPEDSLPYCTTHENFPSTAASYALNYTVERPADGDMNLAALDTAAKTFFEEYLQNLYGSQSKILTVDAVIPLSELEAFDLNDTIEIQGIRYVVDTMRRDLLTNKTKLKLFTYNANPIYTKPDAYLNSGEVTFDGTPNINTLATYRAIDNPAIGGQYLWRPYKDQLKGSALITQNQKNFRSLPKAQGYADAVSGSFTISTSITNVLTIFDTINTQIKLYFNGLPPVLLTHSAVTVTHNSVNVTYSESTPGRITVYEAGTYQFSSTVNFSLATLAQQVKFILAVNGTNFFLNPIMAADTTAAWDITMTAIVPLSIGDYVQLYIYGDISQAYTINSATTKLNRI